MDRPNPWEPRSAIDSRMREERFRELLQVTGMHPIVYQFARMYVMGEIVTFEEALQQIIRRLIRYYEIVEDANLSRYVPSPISVSAEKLAELQKGREKNPPTATGAKIEKENKEE